MTKQVRVILDGVEAVAGEQVRTPSAGPTGVSRMAGSGVYRPPEPDSTNWR
jgi:hypothetical protein